MYIIENFVCYTLNTQFINVYIMKGKTRYYGSKKLVIILFSPITTMCYLTLRAFVILHRSWLFFTYVLSHSLISIGYFLTWPFNGYYDAIGRGVYHHRNNRMTSYIYFRFKQWMVIAYSTELWRLVSMIANRNSMGK